MTLFTPRDPVFEKAWSEALRYLSFRERCEQEIQTWLTQKQYDPQIILQVMERLRHYRYVDDARFAKLFIAQKTRNKPCSRFALCFELQKRGISEDLIAPLLSEYADADQAYRALISRSARWQHPDKKTARGKALGFLRYRGFDYETAAGAWERWIADQEDKS